MKGYSLQRKIQKVEVDSRVPNRGTEVGVVPLQERTQRRSERVCTERSRVDEWRDSRKIQDQNYYTIQNDGDELEDVFLLDTKSSFDKNRCRLERPKRLRPTEVTETR